MKKPKAVVIGCKALVVCDDVKAVCVGGDDFYLPQVTKMLDFMEKYWELLLPDRELTLIEECGMDRKFKIGGLLETPFGEVEYFGDIKKLFNFLVDAEKYLIYLDKKGKKK